MAVGTVSSAAAAVPQRATPPAVLRSGETQASTAAALKNPNSKTYFHRVAGAQFIMPDGLALQFLGGRLVTDDPAIISELDKVANKAASMIFTEQTGIAVVVAQEQAAGADASKTQGDVPAA